MVNFPPTQIPSCQETHLYSFPGSLTTSQSGHQIRISAPDIAGLIGGVGIGGRLLLIGRGKSSVELQAQGCKLAKQHDIGLDGPSEAEVFMESDWIHALQQVLQWRSPAAHHPLRERRASQGVFTQEVRAPEETRRQ